MSFENGQKNRMLYHEFNSGTTSYRIRKISKWSKNEQNKQIFVQGIFSPLNININNLKAMELFPFLENVMIISPVT